MGFTLGEMLRRTFNWKWYYFEEFENDIWGYGIVSPNEEFGICVENIFFKNIFYRKEILFDDLSKLLIEGKFPKLIEDGFEIYEPWKRDYKEYFELIKKEK